MEKGLEDDFFHREAKKRERREENMLKGLGLALQFNTLNYYFYLDVDNMILIYLIA